jgi:hypothetical protein
MKHLLNFQKVFFYGKYYMKKESTAVAAGQQDFQD